MGQLRRTAIVAIAILVPGGCSDEASIRRRATDPGASVLLIVIDTLRADYLGVYGGHAHTPHMDGLAMSGVRFTRAYTPIPLTGPSHSSIFTSLHPRVHGVRNNLQPLPDDHVTLAEMLRAADRRTGGFVSLGVLRKRSGLGQGFDDYQDEFPLDWWKTAAEMNAEIVPWLEHVNAPFFLWVHYSDPHEPYAPPGRPYPGVTLAREGHRDVEIVADARSVSIPMVVESGDTYIQLTSAAGIARRPIRIQDVRVSDADVDVTCVGRCDVTTGDSDGLGPIATLTLSNRRATATAVELRLRADEVQSLADLKERYRQEVEYVDRQIGDLLSALDRTGRRDETLVVMTADHGEGLGDHGYVGHANALFEEQLRVPLILSWPGSLPAGMTVSTSVSLVDVLPTITDLLSIRDESVRSGRSLMPLIRQDPGADVDLPILAETFRPQARWDRRAIISHGVKLIDSPGEGRTDLFDLARDPGELETEAEERTDLVSELKQMMANYQESVPQRQPENPELTEDQLRRLRSLGYVR